MGIEIREADVLRDLPLMRQTHNANRERPASVERFEWLYLHNPDGPARAWFAFDDRTGDLAGFTAVFPRRIRVRGTGVNVLAWNCGDFSINRPYRIGGAAVKLRRAAREAVDRGEISFLYAHPNDGMLPVHLRVGHSRLAQMVRFSKPLRLKMPPPISSLSSAALRVMSGEWMASGGDEVERAREPLGPELDALCDDMLPTLGTALVRDCKYVDWRFRRCPRQMEILVARRAGRLTGYLAWMEKEPGTASVQDWLAADATAWNSLMHGLLRGARGRQMNAVSVILLETNPDIPRFRRFGFVRRVGRGDSTAVCYAPEACAYRSAVVEPGAWFMTNGDRDI